MAHVSGDTLYMFFILLVHSIRRFFQFYSNRMILATQLTVFIKTRAIDKITR